MYLIYLIYRYLLHVGPSMGNLYVNFSFACAMSIFLLVQDLAERKNSATANGCLSLLFGCARDCSPLEGDQVIQSNNFNAGTTIASIADMSKMIFEGKVDEAEVGKIKEKVELEISLGAIEDKKFPAVLNFIAPKGTEENGAVQFTIKADVKLDDSYFLRAGYSANAELILEQKDSVLSIKESLLQFDKKTDKPYVEVKVAEDKFERRDLKLGISDGINIEILSGVTMEDEIKVWNKKAKKEEEIR